MQGQVGNHPYTTQSSWDSARTLTIAQGLQVSWMLDSTTGKAPSFLQGLIIYLLQPGIYKASSSKVLEDLQQVKNDSTAVRTYVSFIPWYIGSE